MTQGLCGVQRQREASVLADFDWTCGNRTATGSVSHSFTEGADGQLPPHCARYLAHVAQRPFVEDGWICDETN
jgi:hypothetical protein